MNSSYRPARGHGIALVATVLLLLVQLGYAAAQVLSFALARELWIADMANFIRPHLLVCGLILFVLGMAIPRRATRFGGVLALVGALLPYVALSSPAPDLGGRPLTLVSANVLVGNPNPQPFLSIPEVASADILVLQEMMEPWQEALADSGYWRHESSRDLRANSEMKVFSRLPIVSETTVSPESRDTGGRHALRFEMLLGESRVVVYAVHAQTPRRPAMWHERTAYFRDLAAAVRSERPDATVIVAGDWNTPPWSPFMRDFLASTGYNNTESRWWPAPTRYSPRFGGGITQIGTPIDRVVLSPNVGLIDLVTGPKFDSNHLPVIARLSIP